MTVAPPQQGAGALVPASRDDGRRPFHVRLDNFDGPFDLLLQLINQRRMDVTEVALHQVTDDFIGHIRAMGSNWDLDQVTEFLVIAATLLGGGAPGGGGRRTRTGSAAAGLRPRGLRAARPGGVEVEADRRSGRSV